MLVGKLLINRAMESTGVERGAGQRGESGSRREQKRTGHSLCFLFSKTMAFASLGRVLLLPSLKIILEQQLVIALAGYFTPCLFSLGLSERLGPLRASILVTSLFKWQSLEPWMVGDGCLQGGPFFFELKPSLYCKEHRKERSPTCNFPLVLGSGMCFAAPNTPLR